MIRCDMIRCAIHSCMLRFYSIVICSFLDDDDHHSIHHSLLLLPTATVVKCVLGKWVVVVVVVVYISLRDGEKSALFTFLLFTSCYM